MSRRSNNQSGSFSDRFAQLDLKFKRRVSTGEAVAYRQTNSGQHRWQDRSHGSHGSEATMINVASPQRYQAVQAPGSCTPAFTAATPKRMACCHTVIPGAN